jgi:hypothetical protein
VFPSPSLKAEPIISPASPFKLKIVKIDLLKPDPLLVYIKHFTVLVNKVSHHCR